MIDLRAGDEVILPSFNFPSAATAVALTGAKPVFVDVDPFTFNLTASGVQHALTSRTKAVIALHYAGVRAPVEAIKQVIRSTGAVLIEDTAHGLGGVVDGNTLGSVGEFATYSFHETKNIQCGEGGALQINDERYVERAEVMREKGTNRKKFFLGQVDKYSWIDHGSSWLLADPLAAILLGQLESFEEIQTSRRRIVDRYASELGEWATNEGFLMPAASLDTNSSAHLYALVAPNLEGRTRFISFLKDQGISATFHYQPLHSSPAGIKLGRANACPESTLLGERLVRLPIYSQMTQEELAFVIKGVRSFHGE